MLQGQGHIANWVFVPEGTLESAEKRSEKVRYGYRFGFQGQEKDDEIYGATGTSYDFGARLYDPRVGRWLSIDPLQNKYPDLSPYAFVGNNPIKFVDYDGQDFGVKIDNDAKTIVIVANVYTTSKKAYNQAMKAAARWNAKSANVEGYTVTFQYKVIEPASVSNDEVMAAFSTVNFHRKNGKLRKGVFEKYKNGYMINKAEESRRADPIGNTYAGNEGVHSRNVSGDVFTGGQTANGKYIDMNTHDENGDMGEYESLVSHELGHTMGLDDEGKGEYYHKGGVMEYRGMNLLPISDSDVSDIVRFARDAIAGKTNANSAKVKVLENKGSSDGSNPLGLKNE